MRLLVGLERSGVIRRALRAAGHDAWSNDLEAADDGSEFHLRMDVREAIRMGGWDGAIFHPVCRYLANSGSKHLYIGARKENGPDPERWHNMREGVELFLDCLNAEIPMIAVENPIIHAHARKLIGMRRTQVVQPWEHGHPENKATCWWLIGLPRLEPTNNVRHLMRGMAKKDTNRVHYMSPGPDRERLRSETLPGVAAAIAAQWFLRMPEPAWEAGDLFEGIAA